MEAKELAPDRTPQTAMKTMLIRGCLRVRSTRGSWRSWKWSWKAAESLLVMGRVRGGQAVGSPYRRLVVHRTDPPNLPGIPIVMRSPCRFVGDVGVRLQVTRVALQELRRPVSTPRVGIVEGRVGMVAVADRRPDVALPGG